MSLNDGNPPSYRRNKSTISDYLGEFFTSNPSTPPPKYATVIQVTPAQSIDTEVRTVPQQNASPELDVLTQNEWNVCKNLKVFCPVVSILIFLFLVTLISSIYDIEIDLTISLTAWIAIMFCVVLKCCSE